MLIECVITSDFNWNVTELSCTAPVSVHFQEGLLRKTMTVETISTCDINRIESYETAREFHRSTHVYINLSESSTRCVTIIKSLDDNVMNFKCKRT